MWINKEELEVHIEKVHYSLGHMYAQIFLEDGGNSSELAAQRILASMIDQTKALKVLMKEVREIK
jgi:hypothetical protein